MNSFDTTGASSRRVGAALLLLLATLVAFPAGAYKIFLKDGTTISARDEYLVQGEFALVTLESGTQTQIRLSELDVDRTAEYNAQPGYSGAIVIDERGRAAPLTTTDTNTGTLKELILSRRGRFGVRSGEEAQGSRALRRTPAGYPDLWTMVRRPLEDRDLAAEILGLLRDQQVGRSSVYSGSSPDRVLVEIVTDTQGAVFQSLKAICTAFVELRSSQPSIEAFEVLMQTGARSRAGQFVLTRENAPLLASGRLSAADFFLEHVQF